MYALGPDVLAYRWMEMSTRDEPDESLRTVSRAVRDTLAERMRIRRLRW